MAGWLSNIAGYFDSSKDASLERPKLEEFDYEKSPKQKKNFIGHISSFKDNEGVIDGNIYFSKSVCTFDNIKVDSKVSGKACRSNSDEAWRATSVSLEDPYWVDEIPICNDDNGFKTAGNVVIGKVTNIYHNLISLDGFSFNSNIDCPFTICVGDWLRCELEVSDKPVQEKKVLKADALRKKTIHGVITHVQPRNFVINEEILCDKSLLKTENVVLKDHVVLDIIESDHGGFGWRATSGKKDPLFVQNQTTKLFRQKPMSLCNLDLKQNCRFPFSWSYLDSILSQNTKFEKECGVSLPRNFEISLDGEGYSDCIVFQIKNISSNILKLQNIWVQSFNRKPQLSIPAKIIENIPISFKINWELTMIVECTGVDCGLSEEHVIFDFEKFKIGRKIKIQVGGRGSNEYKAELPNFFSTVGRIINGEKPKKASHFIPLKLPNAEVPEELEKLVLARGNELEYSETYLQPLQFSNYKEKFSLLLYLEEIELKKQMNKFTIPRASFTHFGEYLSLSVPGLAEKRPSLLIGDSVIVTMPTSEFEFEPSDNTRYEGFIHEVLSNSVLLKFNRIFHGFYKGEDYMVQFCSNRTPFRRCHMAVNLIRTQLGGNVLFPKVLKFELPQVSYIDPDVKSPTKQYNGFKSPTLNVVAKNGVLKPNGVPTDGINRQLIKQAVVKNSPAISSWNIDRSGPPKVKKKVFYTVPKISLINMAASCDIKTLKWKNRSLNIEQKGAVKRILEGSTRPLPYIIFGPPGTGKTVTVVEAVLQIFTLIPHSRILIVTPSNSASDLITARLSEYHNITPVDLLRINSFNRKEEAVPKEIVKFCQPSGNVDLALHHRIIICTAVTSGVLYKEHLKNGHFTHVVIDEAGQLTEPECAIALGLVNASTGQVILAGDPKQLGPVVMSSLAKQYGLSESLLSRLCSNPLYQPEGIQNLYCDSSDKSVVKASENKLSYEPRLVTLLTKSYRSHPDILHIPSQLFYFSALESFASEKIRNRFLNWSILSAPFPILFHGIVGQNRQEGNSPSWFNAEEMYQVCAYTRLLLNDGVEEEDIGIITPYKKQVEKIRRMLSLYSISSDVKVGSVEEFQGQERLVIILSTVRSTREQVLSDVVHGMGFVFSAQRFNVAITRAKSLLIVVGNPFLLQYDQHWRSFIAYCVSKGGYKGEPLQNF